MSGLDIHKPGWVAWAVTCGSQAALQHLSEKPCGQHALVKISMCLRKPGEIEVGYACANSCCTAEQECSIDASKNSGATISPFPLSISVRKHVTKTSLLFKAPRQQGCLITLLAFCFCSECVQAFFFFFFFPSTYPVLQLVKKMDLGSSFIN